MEIPTKPMRPKQSDKARIDREYRDSCVIFCREITSVAKGVDFSISKRGICYILEEIAGLSKGDFLKAERVIDECRKNGLLALHIAVDDAARAPSGLEPMVHDETPEERALEMARDLFDFPDYHPTSFWDGQPYYIEVAVEKTDLVGLFAPVCADFFVSISNAKGWSDINSRARRMRRFREHEEAGRTPVLLYCGDLDPGGVQISDTLRKNFRDLTPAVGWDPENLIIDRFGINADFIAAHNIPWIENLTSSSGKDLSQPNKNGLLPGPIKRYIAQYGVRKVEANSLVTRIEEGRELMREALEKYIDPDDTDKHREACQQAIRDVRKALPAALEALLEERENHDFSDWGDDDD